MTPGRTDILIAGGGFIGLTLALAVARTFEGALTVTVADPGLLTTLDLGPPDPRASAIAGGSRRLFEAIGVWEAIAPFAQTVTGIDLTDSSLDAGVRPILLGYDTTLEDGSPGMTIVENARLRAALVTAAASEPSIRLRPRTTVASMRAERAIAVATLSDGSQVKARFIVAAEGRASRLRDEAGVRCVGWTYDQVGIVTTITTQEEHQGRAVQHFLPAGPFAILPLPGRRACVTWSETAAEAGRLMAADDATFEAEVDRRVGGRLGRVTIDGPRRSWPLSLYLARRLVADRLVLIGDTVRSVHPIAGQGLNLGVRDVAALIDVIAEAARTGQDIGTAPVLEAYERWRRADGVMSAAAFDALNRLFSNDSAVLRTIRDAGLGMVDRLPALKALLVGEASGTTGTVPTLMRREAV
jgi:2-octaprenyl-6-methoxyphenol hydroxylase